MALIKVNAYSFAVMLREMTLRPCTYHDIVGKTGLRYDTVRQYVRELHKQRVVCIAGWQERPDKHGLYALYAVNNGLQSRDVAKPPPMTNAEKSRRHYYKAKARREALAKVSARGIPSNDIRTGGNDEARKHA